MPYIKRSDRAKYQGVLEELSKLIPADPMERPGHINYVVSMLIQKVYGERLRYAQHNEVVGVLHCIVDEFYRRKTAPYEDEKIESEGDLTEL